MTKPDELIQKIVKGFPIHTGLESEEHAKITASNMLRVVLAEIQRGEVVHIVHIQKPELFENYFNIILQPDYQRFLEGV
jgi:phosphotransferase system HPr-like phosphotransfer protein